MYVNVCVCVYLSVCATCAGTCKGHNGALHPLELELQVAVGHWRWVQRTEFRSSGKAASSPNLWSFSLALASPFLFIPLTLFKLHSKCIPNYLPCSEQLISVFACCLGTQFLMLQITLELVLPLSQDLVITKYCLWSLFLFLFLLLLNALLLLPSFKRSNDPMILKWHKLVWQRAGSIEL